VLRARNGKHDLVGDLEIGGLIEATLNDTHDDKLRAMLRDLVPDFVANGTPQGGVPSLTEPPRQRKGRPSGEMRQLV
jgi:hypothetical protein